MQIRPYTEKDFEGIKQIIFSIQEDGCWPLYYPNGWDEARIRSEFKPMEDYKDSIFLISEADKITGFVAGHDLDSFIENEIPHLKLKFDKLGLYQRKAFYQRDIVIHKAYQKGMLGLRLFRALQKHMSGAGYTKLVTRTPSLNLRGKTFFERLGYRTIFQDDNPDRIYFTM